MKNTVKTRADQIFESFKHFHKKNPDVWVLFRKYALEAANSGRSHYSANAIFERIRWHIEIETIGGGILKLNNNHKAYYARLFHQDQPHLDGFFRNRKLTSVDKDAHTDNKQVFIDMYAAEEESMTHQIKNLVV